MASALRIPPLTWVSLLQLSKTSAGPGGKMTRALLSVPVTSLGRDQGGAEEPVQEWNDFDS